MTFEADVHLSPEDLAGYLDRGLSPLEEERVAGHLATCLDCRRELVEVSGLIRESVTERRSTVRSRWIPAGVGVAIAAALVVGLVLYPLPPSDVHRGDMLRPVPSLIAPLGEVSRVQQFRWQPVEGADLYRVTIFSEDGSPLARLDTERPPVQLPDSVDLAAEALHLWQVEARVGVDRWVSSELGQFRLSRQIGP